MSPDASWHPAPQCRKDAVFPVDNDNVTAMLDSVYDMPGHGVGFQHHGVSEVSAQQIGIDKAGSDIREINIQAACVGLLLKRLQIVALQGLGGRI